MVTDGRLAPVSEGDANGSGTNGAAAPNGSALAVATAGTVSAPAPVISVAADTTLVKRPNGARRPAKRARVSLVIPAKNEARNLRSVLPHVPARVDEVILVDGQSTDVTQLMALSCRPDIRIVLERDSGKGHALRSGFAAATGDIIVAMDADGSMHPEEIPNFVWFLEHGFDFVKGSRFVAGGGSLGPSHPCARWKTKPCWRRPTPSTAPVSPTFATATSPSTGSTWTTSTSCPRASRSRPN